MERIQKFLDDFSVCAEQQADIRGAFLIGSYGQKNADALSDLDLALISTKATNYAHAQQWLKQFGTVWAAIYDPQDSISGLPTSASLFTAFSDGFSIDFSIIPAQKTRLWLSLMKNSWIRRRFWQKEAGQAAYLFQKGIVPLFDKDGLVQELDKLKQLPVWVEPFPSAEDFAFLQDDFYFTLVQMRRLLLRGQIYAALSLRDKALRRIFLHLARWQAQINNQEWGNPLRYRDKLLESWADQRFVEALPTIFAAYGAENLWQASRKACQIFELFSSEIAHHFGFKADERLHEVLIWFESEYQER
jgi:hypothetical protein